MSEETKKTNGKGKPETEYSSPIEFPCDFIIKVMGKSDADFESNVRKLIKKHFPNIEEGQFSLRPSKDNNYLAISVVVYAESKEQLDALYQDLSNEPTILMAL